MNNIKSSTKLSARDYWETPQWLVDQLQELLMIGFVLDPCSTEENKKSVLNYNELENGLVKPWFSDIRYLLESCRIDPMNQAVFVNPPFSQLDAWIDKVCQESKYGLTICLLHPDTPDTAWYQKIERHCFLQLVPTSRVNFIDPETGIEKSGVNFPSCISVFNGFPKNNVQRIRFDLNKPKKVNV